MCQYQGLQQSLFLVDEKEFPCGLLPSSTGEPGHKIGKREGGVCTATDPHVFHEDIGLQVSFSLSVK